MIKVWVGCALVFNETGNGERREAKCQQDVSAPSQLILYQIPPHAGLF